MGETLFRETKLSLSGDPSKQYSQKECMEDPYEVADLMFRMKVSLESRYRGDVPQLSPFKWG
ncbi:hypothetical protein DTL21_21005 [Bremerella cremea]|uniref:Uncharacterized protein n=1 Tax=Blastopirellula marina TaxID=124 RepID=A0A2S8FKG7_9BACT|nr:MULTISPECIES: hypothetical protein [Pirellulaceae]PQO32675.1 hypothetical protein C5Y83_20985 [Blastopirellula marina]RCS45742.1 hypothetical protein DTL21_21005 [Bremerella cremea]